MCHPTARLYRHTDAGDGRLRIRLAQVDNDSYAYAFNQAWETVAPNALLPETSGTSHQNVRTAGAGARAHTLQRGTLLDH